MAVNQNGEPAGATAAQAIKAPAFYCLLLCAGLLTIAANLNYQIPGYVKSIGYSPLIAGTVASTIMIGVIIGKFG